LQQKALLEKLKVLIAFRVVFISLLLGTFFLLQLEYSFFPYPRFLLYLIITTYCLNILYLIIIRSKQISELVQGYVQLSLDIVIALLLVLSTGGIDSWFTSTIPLVIIAAYMVIGKRTGALFAAAGGILYGLAIDLQYYKIIPVGYSENLTEKDFLFHIVIKLSAIYLISYLVGYLTTGLEKTKESLDQTSTDLTELSLFHEDVIENIPSGLLSTDLSGNVRLFNKAAEYITNLSRDLALKMNISSIFPFIDSLSESDSMRHTGTINFDKKEKHIGISISVHKNDRGEAIGYIGTFQDLTDIVRLENEIKQREKFAAIGELAANIAHEIRNPLASIKGSIEMIKENRIDEKDKQRLMDITIDEMGRLNTIITEFLIYSNPKPPAFAYCDFGKLVSTTFSLIRSSVVQGKNIVFSSDIADDLGAEIDEDKMRQVLWNLFANALESVNNEGSISVSAKKTDGTIVMDVINTGEGIPPEDHERIFYPFYTTKQSGTGLGLAIVYRIIEEHHGSIDVTSSTGQGARFSIRIPVRQET